jgi:hypothetical protein
MSRFDPPATTRAKMSRSRAVSPSRAGAGMLSTTAAAGHIGNQARQRGGSVFSQCRSGSELVGRGSPVAGGVLGFGEVQARVLCSGRPRA